MSAYFSLIPAAGVGTRMAASQPKQYLPVAGKPVLRHVLETFSAAPSISHTFVVVSAGDPTIAALVAQPPGIASAVTILEVGGDTRRDTVRNGLNAMRDSVQDDDWILVHDAARPGLTLEMVALLIASLRDDPVGGLLALPVVDTVKRAGADGRIISTVARAGLWTAQTPQMFRYRLLCDALAQDGEFTDEASAVEGLGLRPKPVLGDARNFKITLPADLALAELFIRHVNASGSPS